MLICRNKTKSWLHRRRAVDSKLNTSSGLSWRYHGNYAIGLRPRLFRIDQALPCKKRDLAGAGHRRARKKNPRACEWRLTHARPNTTGERGGGREGQEGMHGNEAQAGRPALLSRAPLSFSVRSSTPFSGSQPESISSH
ncbi:hypothetical protein PUN28_018078 [Cardiocondyla obscurior]|uniref:Uncharacterized protein n=1 Tax=Cardiocondyla obscurior TaxID=286306 RepID=A0AAW2EK93_9HYME